MNCLDRDFYVAFVSAFALSLALTFAIFGLLRHSPSSFTSRSISESLADDANKELVGPAKAVHTKRDAIIVPEIDSAR